MSNGIQRCIDLASKSSVLSVTCVIPVVSVFPCRVLPIVKVLDLSSDCGQGLLCDEFWVCVKTDDKGPNSSKAAFIRDEKRVESVDHLGLETPPTSNRYHSFMLHNSSEQGLLS